MYDTQSQKTVGWLADGLNGNPHDPTAVNGTGFFASRPGIGVRRV